MANEQPLQPTKPELSVLKLLWRRKSLSAREITDEVAPEFNWSYSTMRTVLERMLEKGLLTKSHVDGVNVYGAAIGKIALLSRMILDFSDRVLELDVAPSAVMFADSKLLTKDEIDELEKVLRAENEK
jgi:predicted transcriptional regulator